HGQVAPALPELVAGWKVGSVNPATSHVARPSWSRNAIPYAALPSRATWLAGTSKVTHCPNGGSAPMWRRLGDLSTPQAILFLPQYARCSSELPSFHCNITSLGGWVGSR